MLEKLGKTSIFFFLEHKQCVHLAAALPSWSQGTTPAISRSCFRRCELQHRNMVISRMHVSGRYEQRDPRAGVSTHRICRGEEGRMPPASPWCFWVHASSSSPLSPPLLAGGFELLLLMAGKILAPHVPTACREDHTETEEAIVQSTGMAAFAHAFLGTGGASSVFFQLSVNQSP